MDDITERDDRPSRPAAVRKAISRAMKGRSNFEGQTHSKKSKELIQLARGSDDRIQGKKWSRDRETGETNRTHSLPDNHKWGRKSLREWISDKKD